jgi:methyl-accepting chemotaxis protein
VKQTRSLALKIALSLLAIVVASVAVTGTLAWQQMDRAVLALQLHSARDRLAGNLATARLVIDLRYPGPWHVEPAGAGDPSIDMYNGGTRRAAYRTAYRLPGYLYKGPVRIEGNPDVQQTLREIHDLTRSDVTIAQRIPPATSADSTVGDAPDGRALRIATTLTGLDENGERQTAALTVMQSRDPQSGAPIAAGMVFGQRAPYEGRAIAAGAERLSRYEPLVGANGDVVGLLSGGFAYETYGEEASRTSGTIGRWMLFLGLFLVLLLSGAAVAVGARTIGPLRAVRNAARRIAAGDLGARTGIDRDTLDEIGQVAGAFDDMAAQVENLNHRLVVAAEQLTATSRQVDSATAAAAEATRQVATSIGEVSHGASDSATRIDEATKQAHAALGHVRAIQDEVERALIEAGATDALAGDGHALIARSLTVTDGVRVTVGRTRGVMVDLERQAEQIQSIVAIIKRIAQQTNLLALNAAIEAARAGDAGKGFAVVAAEIRSLSDEVRKSSQSIGEIASETKARTGNAVELMGEVDTETLAGSSAVRESDEAFRSITAGVGHLSAQILTIKGAAESVAAAVMALDTAIAGLAATAQESAATSQEVTALAEEQTATLAEITREIHAVSNMAQELKSIVSTTATGDWQSITRQSPVTKPHSLPLAAD